MLLSQHNIALPTNNDLLLDFKNKNDIIYLPDFYYQSDF